jgi:hypothetical protein
MLISFEGLLEIGQGSEPRLLELPDPAFRDLVDRDRIDEVQLLSALALP